MLNPEMMLKVFCLSFITFVITIIFSSCNASKAEADRILIEINFNKSPGNAGNKRPDGSIYGMSIKIKNNTNTVFHYWSMTCSWTDNWVTDNEKIVFAMPECNSNFPQLYEIKSGEERIVNGNVAVLNSLKPDGTNTLKVGFIWIKPDEVTVLSDLLKTVEFKRKNKKDIIWSDACSVPLPE